MSSENLRDIPNGDIDDIVERDRHYDSFSFNKLRRVRLDMSGVSDGGETVSRPIIKLKSRGSGRL